MTSTAIPHARATGASTATDEARRKNAIKGAIFSEYIDMYDIYLPIVVLSPVLFYFQPAHLDPGLQAIFVSLVFITTLLGRPVGSLLFGIMADRTGRRMASITSVAGFGLVTLLIALLPGYETIGISSYWLLVLLRFLDGICPGGGYTGSIPLAFEAAEKSRRGLVGSLIMTGFPAAYVTITLVAMLMFALFPLAGPGSPYVAWGWRIPFVIGAALAGVLALYYVNSVSESEIWEREVGAARAKAPLSSLVRGEGGRAMGQVIVMMTGFWLTQNLITIYLPTTLLSGVLHLSKFELTLTLLVAYCALIVSYVVSGLVAQRIGRRRFFVTMGPIIALAGSAVLYALVTTKGLPLPATIALVCLLSVLVTSPWGVIITYINERFVTDVRATGFGIGFGLSVVIPSFYAFYMNWLGAVMPFELAPVLLLFLGGLMGAVGAWMGPETKDVDF